VAYVYRNPYQQAALTARQELQLCLQKRDELNRRIAELEAYIATHEEMAGGFGEVRGSLPQLCLRLLSFSPANVYQSVPQIRDGLRAMGVEVVGQNPLALLHTTLGRLAHSGFLEAQPPHPGAPVHYRITTAGRVAVQGQ